METPWIVVTPRFVDCAALAAAAYLAPLPYFSIVVFSVAVLTMCGLAGVYGTESLRPFSYELIVVVRCALIGAGLLIVTRNVLELPWTFRNPAVAVAVFVAGAVGGRVYLHRRDDRQNRVLLPPEGTE